MNRFVRAGFGIVVVLSLWTFSSISVVPYSFCSLGLYRSSVYVSNACWAQESTTPSASADVGAENAPTAGTSDPVAPDATPKSVSQPESANSAAKPEQAKKESSTFWTIVSAGGTIGFVLLGLSIAALTIAIDVLRTLRRSVFMPDGLAADVRELLNRGQLLAADQRCRQTPCCLSYVINAGLAESDGDWPDIEKTLEDSMAEQSSRYLRKIETLSVIGNIAPMLGLLGTVVGMVYAFSLLAQTQGTPRPSELAEGIYLALVTTVEGLIVAIPSLAAFAWFRNRIDQLMTEVAFQTQHVFLPLKRQIRANKRPAAIQQPPRPSGK